MLGASLEQHVAFHDGWMYGYDSTQERWKTCRFQPDYHRTCVTVRSLAEQRVARAQHPNQVAYALGILLGSNAAYVELGDGHSVPSLGEYLTKALLEFLQSVPIDVPIDGRDETPDGGGTCRAQRPAMSDSGPRWSPEI